MKPRIFVASSVEGLGVAYAVQECLEYEFEITVWPQGVFELTKTTIETLDELSRKFDAAVFVFSPDDEGIVRNVTRPTIRDNVLFELGLFMGRVGRDKCFIVKPRSFDAVHFPSDLFGVTPGVYDDNRTDDNLVAAVGPTCNKIRRALAPPKPPEELNAANGLITAILSRPYRLYYNPPGRSKRIVFSEGGLISEGNNKNEHSWRIVDGMLELVQLDGQVHSRFKYDSSNNTFKHTNDPDTLSLRSQFIEPEGRGPEV